MVRDASGGATPPRIVWKPFRAGRVAGFEGLDFRNARSPKNPDKDIDDDGRVGFGITRKPVIGLALGGGAARGFAHIGIVKTLVARGIVPNVVVGTSIGAVVGGAYAAG